MRSDFLDIGNSQYYDDGGWGVMQGNGWTHRYEVIVYDLTDDVYVGKNLVDLKPGDKKSFQIGLADYDVIFNGVTEDDEAVLNVDGEIKVLSEKSTTSLKLDDDDFADIYVHVIRASNNEDPSKDKVNLKFSKNPIGSGSVTEYTTSSAVQFLNKDQYDCSDALTDSELDTCAEKYGLLEWYCPYDCESGNALYNKAKCELECTGVLNSGFCVVNCLITASPMVGSVVLDDIRSCAYQKVTRGELAATEYMECFNDEYYELLDFGESCSVNFEYEACKAEIVDWAEKKNMVLCLANCLPEYAVDDIKDDVDGCIEDLQSDLDDTSVSNFEDLIPAIKDYQACKLGLFLGYDYSTCVDSCADAELTFEGTGCEVHSTCESRFNTQWKPLWLMDFKDNVKYTTSPVEDYTCIYDENENRCITGFEDNILTQGRFRCTENEDYRSTAVPVKIMTEEGELHEGIALIYSCIWTADRYEGNTVGSFQLNAEGEVTS